MITKEEFSTLREEIPDIDIEDLKKDLVEFNELLKKAPLNFDFKKMQYEFKGNEVDPMVVLRFK